MRTLFELDAKNYSEKSETVSRPSVRAIIIHGGKIAMVHSVKYDYYKFPGGGIEGDESHIETLVRETMEEAGLSVDSSTVREYGNVHRAEGRILNGTEQCFVQDNFYYLCDAVDNGTQSLDDYEADEQFTPLWIEPQVAISANRLSGHGPKSRLMTEREARVLEMLVNEGYFGD